MPKKATSNKSRNSVNVVALITARGGSKGLPRKNVLPAGGKPLMAWTVTAAQEAQCVDRVVLSSDDDEIMAVAAAWGCDVPFRRPGELASDTASSMDVVLHALDQLPGYDYVALLQPTSPLRTAADIDAAFSLLQASGAPSCVSVCEAEQSPYWMYRLAENGKLHALLPERSTASRRQDLPPVYVLNGAIYIARVDWLRATGSFLAEESIAYVMPRERSIDIDNVEDFEIFRRKVEQN
ncbi:acylneuraminate cytidylyltransferase family protein [Vogesella indigofera]|uniref:acylneuraminate cytidylyltransferase family protein n=1 Tax=Vogesella indigofera TaxID=45465 RepID=UPI00234F6A46|nr:acylneuraminate cytidylyltransferase family protein [Vogesella indigofera]MDC7700857.1 acylneuraminate cytidylyltransferase family protein [Vogesella indigofera]